MVESGTIRTFVALRPEPRVAERLAARAAALQHAPWSREVRWTPEENVHLTLRFLGNTPAGTVDEIARELRALAPRHAFPYRIDRIVLFPNARRPRVVAAQIEENATLMGLAQEIERVAQRAGFTPERRAFKAHLTLGRIGPNFPRGARIEPLGSAIDGVAREIVLFRSDTRSSGAVYTPLATIMLADG